MSRAIKDIYEEIVSERDKRLELSEFKSDSKLSILNGIAWFVAAAIFSFETILDVFTVDISTALNSRINGTAIYYANALLKYQKGDKLVVREDGLGFGYSSVDETKRIITQVTYHEVVDVNRKLVLKIATGEKGKLTALPEEELVMIRAYMQQIKFIGPTIEVTSRKGDVLIPYLTVFYDGSISEGDLYDVIEQKLNEYIIQIDFGAKVYVSKIIECLTDIEQVADVYIDDEAEPKQGIYLACYNGDGKLNPTERVKRMTHTESGYLRQSSCQGEESELPNFRQAIKLMIHN